jgi:hypothetical protein
MKLRPWAAFTADLPDDHIEDGTEIIQFGGKSVVRAIGDMLALDGHEVSEPIYLDENGWGLHITAEKRRLWCQVTLIDGYVMVLEQNSWIAEVLGRLHPAYLRVLRELGIALAGDPRFHDVRWYTSDELHTEAQGAVSPVEN